MFHVKHPNQYKHQTMDKEKIEKVKNLIRTIPDFPTKGIMFRDLTTAFKNPEGIAIIAEDIEEKYSHLGVTKVVGIEARGFIGGSILAHELGAGFVPLRKPGKLPADTISKTYAKEYGTDTIEIHRDAISEDDVVVLHDDVLATGGTMAAAVELVKSLHPKKIYVNFIIELEALHGRDALPDDVEVTSLIKY